jgi:HAMP domain-containing protein
MRGYLGPSFVRTRVARRLLALFLLCAVVPVACLAAAGYYHVAGALREQAEDDLHAAAKTAGMIIFDRLRMLSSSLGYVAATPDDPAWRSDEGTIGDGQPRFEALGIEEPDGTVETLRGQLGRLPELAETQQRHLDAGGVVLVTVDSFVSAEVFLVRRLRPPAKGRVWGRVLLPTVLGAGPGRSPVPPGTSLCTAGQTLSPILCRDPEALEALRGEPDQPTFTWAGAGATSLAGQWTVFLRQIYLAPAWIVVVSRPLTAVRAPLVAFRRTFALGVLLALVLVFTLSHVQLRRTTTPLEELQAGTVRLGAGDFTQPVRVRSGDEFETLADSFNDMAGELRHHFEAQRALQEVDRTAMLGRGVEPVLAEVFRCAGLLLPGWGLSVALARPDDPFWWVVYPSGGGPGRDLSPHPEEIEELERHREGFVVRSGQRGRTYFEPPAFPLEREAIVLPLHRNGGLTGAFVLDCLPPRQASREAVVTLRRLADPIVVALSNAQLVVQLDMLSWGALRTLARTIDAVSPWTAGHSERVTLGAIEIGRRLGLGEEELTLIHRGGLLHDIGKVGIPATILDKPGPLTDEEYRTVQQHPSVGARILSPIGAFRSALPLVLQHHELLDGSGYPHGLKGEQIPLIVRILTVSDIFDALVSDRPYRAAWPVERALSLLREGAGLKFDPRAVEALSAAVSSGWSAKTAATTEPLVEPHPPRSLAERVRAVSR